MHNKFTGEIDAVRTALRQFDCKQTDFAVRFHVAIVDANLRAASEGHDDPIFREGFALCVHHLAEFLWSWSARGRYRAIQLVAYATMYDRRLAPP
jgi:hypothetical protein